jgi:hypothetical protein
MKNTMMIKSVVALTLLLSSVANAAHTLLLGNTRADNIVSVFSGEATEYLADIPNPDHIVEYEGNMYFSAGTELEDSAIYKLGDEELTIFATGGGLKRPYGFKFYEGLLYVASFMSDQVLTYNATTGEFIEVFAAGNGTEEGLCNGPNHIDIYEGMLYMTTQGSTVISGELAYLFPSQVLKYSVATKEGEVFIPPPEVLPGGLGFVSMLACVIYCDDLDVCSLFTSDFAGGLRKYDLEGELEYAVETTYTPGASTGALAIGRGSIYIPGFVNETTPGVVMEFALSDGSGLGDGNGGIVSFEDEALIRPVGIFYMPLQDTSGAFGITQVAALTPAIAVVGLFLGF